MNLVLIPVVVDPGPGTARDWVSRELARPEYQESLLQRAQRWFGELLDRVSATPDALSGLSPLVGLLLLVLVVALGAFLLSRLGANPALPAGSAEVFAVGRDPAVAHRSRAEAALAAGRWDESVLEAVRALTSTLVERGLAPERAGVTVHEITADAARLFPAEQGRLEQVGRTFDETRYGDRPTGEDQARAAVELERDLARATPGGARVTGPVAAAPR
ncbi:DUF4129 domain-containing protein [Nocardioides korecus]